MIGNDADRYVDVFIFAVLFSRKRFNAADDRNENIDFVNGLHTAEHRDRALGSHAGVDAFSRKGFERTVCGFIVLHKYVVPDFDVFSARTARPAVRSAGFFPRIVKNFRIGTAWTGQTRRPPPVVAPRQIKNPLARNAAAFPNGGRFVVARHRVFARKHRHGNFFRRNRKPFFTRQKFPAESDRFFFKIIAERPVAEHFKKRQVRRISNRIDIAGAHAFLIIGEPRSFGVILPRKIGNKRLHAGGRKQNGGIVVGNERLTAYFRMPFAFKKRDIFGSKFIYSHKFDNINSPLQCQGSIRQAVSGTRDIFKQVSVRTAA